MTSTGRPALAARDPNAQYKHKLAPADVDFFATFFKATYYPCKPPGQGEKAAILKASEMLAVGFRLLFWVETLEEVHRIAQSFYGEAQLMKRGLG